MDFEHCTHVVDASVGFDLISCLLSLQFQDFYISSSRIHSFQQPAVRQELISFGINWSAASNRHNIIDIISNIEIIEPGGQDQMDAHVLLVKAYF